jgi:hypothetical protein
MSYKCENVLCVEAKPYRLEFGFLDSSNFVFGIPCFYNIFVESARVFVPGGSRCSIVVLLFSLVRLGFDRQIQNVDLLVTIYVP